jgi:hypothetical protein
MPHFNPQMCEPSCCVNAGGGFINFDPDSGLLCFETFGDVIRAELWLLVDPPALIGTGLGGCICLPVPGIYQLRVYISIGDGEVYYVADEYEVLSLEPTGLCECDYWDGKTVQITFEGTGAYSVLSGTYYTYLSGCSFYFQRIIGHIRGGVEYYYRPPLYFDERGASFGVYSGNARIYDENGFSERFCNTEFWPWHIDSPLLTSYVGLTSNCLPPVRWPAGNTSTALPEAGRLKVSWVFLDVDYVP